MLHLIRPFPALLIAVLTLAAAGHKAALAQYADAGRVVRVTTGAYQFKGWERPLIQGNPNLSHFCWVPVTGYAQGTQRVVQRRGPDLTVVQTVPGKRSVAVRKQAPVYMKPVHVPANYVPSHPGADFGKPVRVPTIVKPATTEQDALHGAIRLPAPARVPDVSAKMALKQPDEAVSARLAKPVVAVYPELAGSLLPRNGLGMLEGNLASKSVHGRLTSTRRHK